MPSFADAVLEFHNIISSRFGVLENTGQSVFVAFELGTPVSLSALAQPTNPSTLSPALALEFISNLANTVPRIEQSMFFRGLETVDGQYDTLLVGSASADPTQTDLFANVNREARDLFDNDLQSLTGPHRFHPTHPTPANWFDPTIAENWTPVHVEGADKPQSPETRALHPLLSTWRLSSAPSIAAASNADAELIVAPAFAHAVPESNLVVLHIPRLHLELNQPGERPASVSPADFNDKVVNASNEVPVVVELFSGFITRARLLRPKLEGAVRAARIPISLLRFDMDENKNAPIPGVPPIRTIPNLLAFMNGRLVQQIQGNISDADLEAFFTSIEDKFIPTGEDKLLIDFEMCLLQLSRPWLSDRLLTLPGWFVSGFHKGDFSDATASDNRPLSAMPVAAVLVRNLSVRARWTTKDRDLLDRSMSLGPFSLAGHALDENSGELFVKGIQVVAWVCAIMPILPPMSDPAHPQ